MGCCQARSPKMEEDFFTIGLCFIEKGTSKFDQCPYDKLVYRYMLSNDDYEDKDLHLALGISTKTLMIDNEVNACHDVAN